MPDAEYFAAVLMRRYADRHGIEVKHHWLTAITRGRGVVGRRGTAGLQPGSLHSVTVSGL